MGEAADIQRRYFECIERRDFEGIRTLIGEGYTYVDPSGEVGEGADAAIAVPETYMKAFPDMSFEIRGIHEAGKVSVMEFTARGTNTGELMGTPPTGRPVEIRVCNLIEVKDGKIVAERDYWDQMSMMQQLGLVPEQATA